jgi:hypothetical protein
MTKKWRTTFYISPLLVSGILIAFSSSSLAYQPPATHGNTRMPNAAAPGARVANETYSVVQIGEEIKVVSASEKKTLIKKLEDDYKLDTKKYTDAKKDKKNADANSLKKPDKKDYTIKILKANFKTQDEAQKFADDKIAERDKGAKKSTDESKKW